MIKKAMYNILESHTEHLKLARPELATIKDKLDTCYDGYKGKKGQDRDIRDKTQTSMVKTWTSRDGTGTIRNKTGILLDKFMLCPCQSSFCSESSRHCIFQTVRSKELTF